MSEDLLLVPRSLLLDLIGENCPSHAEPHSPQCSVCEGVQILGSKPYVDPLIERLRVQREWSEEIFGPGSRLNGVLQHIEKELDEIRAAPTDCEEWIDVVILAFDGAWRAGYSAEEIVAVLDAKWAKNRAREWPDWRTASPDEAITHVKGVGD